MKLPRHQEAIVPEDKITGYLLSLGHPDGRSKAQFFIRFGFTVEAWEVLAEALRRHAAEHQVTGIEDSPFGTRYVIEGIISAPDGRKPLIRAVWFVETGEQIPRFVTAYPLSRRDL